MQLTTYSRTEYVAKALMAGLGSYTPNDMKFRCHCRCRPCNMQVMW